MTHHPHIWVTTGCRPHRDRVWGGERDPEISSLGAKYVSDASDLQSHLGGSLVYMQYRDSGNSESKLTEILMRGSWTDQMPVGDESRGAL